MGFQNENLNLNETQGKYPWVKLISSLQGCISTVDNDLCAEEEKSFLLCIVGS